MNKSTAPLRFQQHQQTIRQRVRHNSAVDFFNLLTGPQLLELTEAHLPEYRERLYPPTVALSMFIKQARYPQPSSQAPGVGFPLARLVGVICLATGAVVDASIGPFAGKGQDSQWTGWMCPPSPVKAPDRWKTTPVRSPPAT